MSILLCVLFHDVDGQLHITASNLECSATIPLGIEPFNLAVPFDELYKWLQKVEAPTVEITVTGTNFVADAGDAKCVINGMEAEMYPSHLTVDEDYFQFPFEIPLSLKRALRCASGTDEKMSILNGVNIVNQGSDVLLRAADGFQGCITKVQADIPPLDVTIPVDSMNALVPFLGNAVLCATNQYSLVTFKDETFSFSSSLLSGKFPAIEQIIPKSTTSSITVDGKELKRMLSQALIFSLSNFVKFEIKDSVAYITTGGITDKADAYLPIIECSGDNVEFGINARMLVDKMEDTEITIGANGPSSPIVLTYKDDDTHKVVIMPMSLKR
jgi:DNA polymerase III sliding clamp (beta) subunit (PCNA family)